MNRNIIGPGNNEVNKLDKYPVDGLLGIPDSLAYKISEFERHMHNREFWFGLAVVPTASHNADRIGSSIAPFEFVSGNNAWGAWTNILGSEDTPVMNGSIFFDPHRAVVLDTDMIGTHFFQMTIGPDPDISFASGIYTEFVYISASNQIDVGTIDIMAHRQPVGYKTWARMLTPGFSGKILHAYIGLHEYEG